MVPERTYNTKLGLETQNFNLEFSRHMFHRPFYIYPLRPFELATFTFLSVPLSLLYFLSLLLSFI